VNRSLGSRTSGVDGSSEGGRINTINLPGALVIYGVALVQSLQRRNPKSKLSVAPVQVDGQTLSATEMEREIRALRKQVHYLEQQRSILKKALSILGEEPNPGMR